MPDVQNLQHHYHPAAPLSGAPPRATAPYLLIGRHSTLQVTRHPQPPGHVRDVKHAQLPQLPQLLHVRNLAAQVLQRNTWTHIHSFVSMPKKLRAGVGGGPLSLAPGLYQDQWIVNVSR